MIAMLLAAQLSAGMPADVVHPVKPVIIESAELLQGRRLASAGVCAAASRLQTSFATPMLLFREQDRPAAVARKLKDLPPAVGCLVGAASEEAAK